MQNLKQAGQITEHSTKTIYRFFAHRRLTDDEIHLALGKGSLRRDAGTVIEQGIEYKLVKIEAGDGWEGAD